MLTKVLEEIGVRSTQPNGIHLTPYEISTQIISGLYREMRKEETPKPVLLLAACEVLTQEVIGKDHELKIYNNGALNQVVVDWWGDTDDAVSAGTLANALIEFADGLAE